MALCSTWISSFHNNKIVPNATCTCTQSSISQGKYVKHYNYTKEKKKGIPKLFVGGIVA